MNDIEIVVGGRYKTQNPSIDSEFTDNLYVVRRVKISKGFFRKKILPGIVYSKFADGSFESIMTEEEFHNIALYRVE